MGTISWEAMLWEVIVLEFIAFEAFSGVGSWMGVRVALIAHYCFLLLSFFHSCISIAVAFYPHYPPISCSTDKGGSCCYFLCSRIL